MIIAFKRGVITGLLFVAVYVAAETGILDQIIDSDNREISATVIHAGFIFTIGFLSNGIVAILAPHD